MRFASLGSGSQGNALVVEAGSTRVLLDCGFRIRETVGRLAQLGLAPDDLAAIVISHEHDDHIAGAIPFARKYNLPLWLTYGTMRAMTGFCASLPSRSVIEGHRRFSIGDISIEPYPVPHDAREPAQFVFSDGARKLGVLTDSGCTTRHIEAVLRSCDALVLECNHDGEMLRKGVYPPRLKARISGRLGHLDNADAANLLNALDCARLQHIVAAHVSQQNNTPQLARAALGAVLNCADEWVTVADQVSGFSWRQIT
ncbi:MAG: MBL fold metallo-hydrolase [Burkholderiales bacterium]|nr:MBL fold metallo-hydrolase [Burkholderiales bacterium]